MAKNDSPKVSMGDSLLNCRTAEDAAILEPVGGILVDRSTEGYTPEQLDQMVATLATYDRPAELESLKRLIAQRGRA